MARGDIHIKRGSNYGTLNPGRVETADLADAAVTKPKLATGLFRKAVVTGGAAGNHTVTGIAVGDSIVSILYFAGAGTTVTNVADLTSEFTITAADTINNAGGTNTTGGKLVVEYQDRA